ncbi:hypothetical protein pdam_00014520 [Pocillopora damicornis]|uniref:Uncharacterized protein n=1 Tax=Pocillopora damicornis TaxID=46731 RepID=A0A3M6U0B3_POCDA|nr:hypothetical protein pdam_00014520 [Pocillopora damicornis]
MGRQGQIQTSVAQKDTVEEELQSLQMSVEENTKFRRRQETKNVLEFIHRGKEGSIYGAWDDISSAADNQTMDKLICGHKRGKYLRDLFDMTMKGYQNSDEALKQAVFM